MSNESSRRKATAKQLEFARELGLNVPDDITAAQVSVLIDAALEDQREEAAATILPGGKIDPWLRVLRDSTPDDMVNELHRRGVNAFLVSWEEGEKGSCTLTHGGMEIEEVYDSLFLMGLAIIKRRNPEFAALLAGKPE
jgi:hypothetical protein